MPARTREALCRAAGAFNVNVDGPLSLFRIEQVELSRSEAGAVLVLVVSVHARLIAWRLIWRQRSVVAQAEIFPLFINLRVSWLHVRVEGKDLICQELLDTVVPLRLGVGEIDEFCACVDGVSGADDFVE